MLLDQGGSIDRLANNHNQHSSGRTMLSITFDLELLHEEYVSYPAAALKSEGMGMARTP
jgi:hypothetical protein